MPSVTAMRTGAAAKIDVTIVMPCLNEAKWLPACIANANAALTRIRAELGLNGEILIADNGSADGSQLIADQIVFISEITQRYFAGLECARLPRLIFNGLDTNVFTPLATTLKR